MKEVAQHAGVSIATVSYTLHTPDRVSDATRQRVEASIKELGFVVNSAARTMRTGEGPGMGIVIGELSHSFSVGVVRGAQAGAREVGTTMLIANADKDDAEQSRYVELFDQARMQGIILAPLDDNPADIDRLRDHGTPVVLVNLHTNRHDHCSVLMDNEEVGFRAAEHLISLGCRKLVFATGYPRAQPLADRKRGIDRALKNHPEVTLDVYARQQIDAEDGRAIAGRILAGTRERRPDGIIAATEMMALGLIEELLIGGIKVPEDIKLISTEENRNAFDAPVRISRLQEPAFDMGWHAAQLLAEEVHLGDKHKHQILMLHATLFAGESTLGRGARTVEEVL